MRVNDKKGLIETANQKAVERMLASRPVLVDVRRAIDVIPGMKKNEILHAGPPVTWELMCPPMKGALLGAAKYEGLARDSREAERRILAGEITFSPCHHHNTIGIMAGITSASMAVFIVEDKTHGHFTYANIRDEAIKSLRFGVYDENVKRNLDRNALLGPVIGAALRACGGIDLISLIARSLQMGDDGHNRNLAQNALFCIEIMPHLFDQGFDTELLKQTARWFAHDERLISTAVMAACKAMCLAGHGVEGSTLVTVMARNGTDFGIRVSGLGDQWFNAPSPKVDALYFAGYGPGDAGLDMGDSAITETAGIGAFAMAGAPSMVELIGGNVADAVRYTREMYEITSAKNAKFAIPYLDFSGCPTGIDLRKVIRTGITPVIDTAVSHKRPGIGQIGAGISRAPMKCFEQAIREFARKMNLS
ncbi:MAG: DUF1116 domain-containing protein [Desulfobacterales bacterium]|nr:DUF1116 domain-containing protein [Desulfobacterales bacterium]